MPRPVEHVCIFDPVEHAYRDEHGRRYRSVTQILAEADCVDFSMVDPVVLRLAAERGTRVHELTALWDKHRAQLSLDAFFICFAVAESLQGYVRQYERFLIETGFSALAEETERPRLVELHGTIVGMTPDRVGYFPRSRRLSVIDLKTGMYQLSHPLQIAGYSLGFERVLKLAMLHDRLALYLEPDFYRMQTYPHATDYYAFLDAINGGGKYLEHWKDNRKRKLIA